MNDDVKKALKTIEQIRSEEITIKDAHKIFDALKVSNLSNDVLFSLGTLYLKENDVEQSIRWLSAASEKGHIDSSLLLMRVCARSHRLNDAKSYLNKLLKHDKEIFLAEIKSKNDTYLSHSSSTSTDLEAIIFRNACIIGKLFNTTYEKALQEILRVAKLSPQDLYKEIMNTSNISKEFLFELAKSFFDLRDVIGNQYIPLLTIASDEGHHEASRILMVVYGVRKYGVQDSERMNFFLDRFLKDKRKEYESMLKTELTLPSLKSHTARTLSTSSPSLSPTTSKISTKSTTSSDSSMTDSMSSAVTQRSSPYAVLSIALEPGKQVPFPKSSNIIRKPQANRSDEQTSKMSQSS